MAGFPLYQSGTKVLSGGLSGRELVRLDNGSAQGIMATVGAIANLNALSFEQFYAVGDGVTDDTEALNRAISASALTGLPVVGKYLARYRVSAQGVHAFRAVNPIIRSTCVRIPHGATVDWNGSTLVIDKEIDAVVLSNEASDQFTASIRCMNVVIDGGGVPLRPRTLPLVWFFGITDSIITGMTVQNGSYLGCQISAATDSHFGEFVAQNFVGNGFGLGGNTTDQIRRCTISSVHAENINTLGTFNQPGNGIFIGAADTEIEVFSQRNCAGGIKFGPNCNNVHANLCIADGTVLAGEVAYGTSNSGVKFQGDDANSKLDFVTVGTIVAKKQVGAGLFGRFFGRLLIGQYSGDHNGSLGADNDMDIAGDYLEIAQVASDYAGLGGLYVPAGATATRIGDMIVRNCGEVIEATAFGVFPNSGDIHFNSLVVMDDRGVPKATKAVLVNQDVQFSVDSYKSNMTNSLDLRVTKAFLGKPVLGASPLTDLVTLAAGTTTDVANANVKSQAVTGGFVEPIIQFLPLNAAAVALGQLRYFINANGSFRIVSPAAAGTELFQYIIVGYNFRTTQLAA